jgi:tetratricopeptide (TPR) repeat protein
MGFELRLPATVALALASAACTALPPARTGWTIAEMFGAPQEADAYADFLAARYAGMTDDPVAAARFYRRAYDRAPDEPAALERAAFATLVEGEVKAAASLAAGADPAVLAGAPFAQLAMIVDDIQKGRNERALARLTSARLGAINDDASRALTAWLQARTDVDAAIATTTPPAGRRRMDGEYLLVQGMILMSAERDAEAVAKFAAARETGVRSPLGAAEHARALTAQGDFAAAQAVLADYVDRFGSTPEIDAAAAFEADARAGGEREPKRLTTRQGAAAAIYALSAGSVTQSNAELGSLYFSLALHLDPELELARLGLADALREQDRQEAALDVLSKVSPASVYYAGARVEQGWMLQALDRPADALAAADEAAALKPAGAFDRHVRQRLGELYGALKRPDRAEALFSQVVEADSAAGKPDWRPLFQRANAREQLGRWDDAERDLLAALNIEPDQPDVLNFLGYGWIDRGENIDEGFRLIRKAVAERPDAGYIVDSLGWAHYRLGQYEEAVEQLERAVELSPSDPVVADHLGDAYWQAGRRIEAGYQWAKALELKPEPALEASLRGKAASGLSDSGRSRIAGDIDPQRTRQ